MVQGESATFEKEDRRPPASFEWLVLSLRMQAEMFLGLLHAGDEKERPEPDLPAARHAIDLLGVLEEKTKGNLTLEEERLLQNSLTELRFRFVQAFEKKQKASSPECPPQPGSSQ